MPTVSLELELVGNPMGSWADLKFPEDYGLTGQYFGIDVKTTGPGPARYMGQLPAPALTTMCVMLKSLQHRRILAPLLSGDRLDALLEHMFQENYSGDQVDSHRFGVYLDDMRRMLPCR